MKQYRQQLVDTQQKISESYDKTIITLSGGALGISFTFIKNFIGSNQVYNIELLFLSWTLLTLSLASVLFSLFFGILAFKKAIEQVDDKTVHETKADSYYARVTSILHASGAILLLVGLFILGGFVYSNSGEINNVNREKNTSSTTSSTATRTKRANIFRET